MSSKNKMWQNFFANLFGIILGITLTFGVNALWQKHEENKKMKEMLSLIRGELEVNKEMFENQKELLQKHLYYYKKALEINNKWENIPEDSIINYVNLASIHTPEFQTYAWQIFQNSEVIQKTSDKELVFWLTQCYYRGNTFYNFLMNTYWNKKINETLNTTSRNVFIDKINSRSIESLEFLKSSEGTSFFENFSLNCDMIDFVISKMEKYKIRKSNFEEMYKKFDIFLDKRRESRNKNEEK